MPLSAAARAAIRELEQERAGEVVLGPTPEEVHAAARASVADRLAVAEAVPRWRVGAAVDVLVRRAEFLTATRRQQTGRLVVGGGFGAATDATRLAYLDLVVAAVAVADEVGTLPALDHHDHEEAPVPTEPTDPTEPRDADDAIRRGLAEDLANPRGSFLDEHVEAIAVRDDDGPLRRGLAAALTASRTDKENRS